MRTTCIGPRSEYSLVDSIEKRVESPFQKYSRLRAEVEELQNDLKSINEVLDVLMTLKTSIILSIGKGRVGKWSVDVDYTSKRNCPFGSFS